MPLVRVRQFCFLLLELLICLHAISRDTNWTCARSSAGLTVECAAQYNCTNNSVFSSPVWPNRLRSTWNYKRFAHFTISVGETRRIYFSKEKICLAPQKPCDVVVCVCHVQFTDYWSPCFKNLVVLFGLKMFSVISSRSHCNDTFNKPVL